MVTAASREADCQSLALPQRTTEFKPYLLLADLIWIASAVERYHSARTWNRPGGLPVIAQSELPP
jgi:hypothetical protein